MVLLPLSTETTEITAVDITSAGSSCRQRAGLQCEHSHSLKDVDPLTS